MEAMKRWLRIASLNYSLVALILIKTRMVENFRILTMKHLRTMEKRELLIPPERIVSAKERLLREKTR